MTMKTHAMRRIPASTVANVPLVDGERRKDTSSAIAQRDIPDAIAKATTHASGQDPASTVVNVSKDGEQREGRYPAHAQRDIPDAIAKTRIDLAQQNKCAWVRILTSPFILFL